MKVYFYQAIGFKLTQPAPPYNEAMKAAEEGGKAVAAAAEAAAKLANDCAEQVQRAVVARANLQEATRAENAAK